MPEEFATVDTSTQERPNNPDAERAVLAAMILDQVATEEALAKLQEKDFYLAKHRNIFAAVKELVYKRTPVDQVTLADRLEARGELERIGGLNYIIELANNSLAIYNWEHHAEIVQRYSLMRDLIDAARGITALAYSPMDDSEEIVEKAEAELLNVTQQRVESHFEQLKELLNEAQNILEEQSKQQNRLLGVPTGFVELDRRLLGLRGGDLVILAARPGVGKSALALNMAVNAALRDVTVAFFSLEMPAVQLTQRIICAEGAVNNYKMRSANFSDQDWLEIVQASGRLYDCNLYIDDNPSLNLTQLRAKARRQLRNTDNGKGLIIIDYLQLMETSSVGFARQRYIEVGELTRGLKVLAKELNVPILVLSQLSRGVEARQDKRPQLSDLRESGSIEQDADVVLFIDRDTYRDKDDPNDKSDPSKARLIIGKNRNGTTGTINLIYDEPYTRFRTPVVGNESGQAESGYGDVQSLETGPGEPADRLRAMTNYDLDGDNPF